MSPPRYGLMASSQVIQESDPHFGQGISWVPEPCATQGAGLDPTCGTELDFDVPEDECELREFQTILAWEASRLSNLDRTDIEARTIRKLERSESRQLEAELWLGALAQAGSYDQFYLTGPDTDVLEGGNAIPLDWAVATLQQEAATAWDGAPAMLHASVFTVSLMYKRELIRREGGLWRDAFDNIVVAGVGYDGSGPEDPADDTRDTAWIYATTPVVVRRGPVTTEAAGAYATNERFLWAYRPLAYSIDCPPIGIKANQCSLCCEEGSPEVEA